MASTSGQVAPTAQSQTATTSTEATSAPKQDKREDPVSKLKTAIPLLRESITSLLEQASIVIQLQSSGEPIQVDTTDGKLTLEQQNTKFAKALEEFYHTCDTLETSIMLARSTVTQYYESMKFTSSDSKGIPDPNVPPQTYSDYLSSVRTQVTATKELHDLLTDFSRSLHD